MQRLLTALAFIFFSFAASAQFQGLIVNEFSQGDQGSREYIELLVVGTRTCTDSTADLRGWIFDDQNGWYGTNSITPNHYRFANVSNWAAVPFGSLIIFYNNTSGEKNLSIIAADDPTDANHDYAYILPINSSTYLEENNSEPLTTSGPTYAYPLASATAGYSGSTNAWLTHIALNNGGDVISTVSPSNRTSAFFSIGYNFPINTGFQTPTVSVANASGGKNCYLSTSNYTSAASWITGNADPSLGAVNETPAAPNGGANSTWIMSMRQQTTPPAPGVNVTQPDCNFSTGTIAITSPFGAGYTYSKDGINYGQFNTVFTNLSPGVYSITVKFGGCVSAPTIVTINAAPTVPSTPAITITQPDCNNPAGTVTITSPTGAGLTYSISGTYQSSNVFTGVTPGPYGVTVKNTGGCTSTATIITIDAAPPAPAAPVVNITSQPTCANPVGSISISGPAGMNYSVDGVDYSNTTGIFNNLSAGSYNVTAKNSSGCISPATAVIVNAPPQAPATPVLSVGQTSCNSAAGSIIITSPIGSGLMYSIDGMSYSSQTVYNSLLPGNYFVTVQNATGCTSAAVPVTINPQPAVPAAPTITVVQPTCTAMGTINITAPSGMSYSLDGINYTNTTGVFSNLQPGNYSVTVQNGSGCISAPSNAVVNPQPGAPTVSVNSPTICQGSNATITATSPAGSYNYVWTVPAGEANPGNVASFNSGTAGTYTVNITNAAGCSTSATATITVNALPAIATVNVTQPTCSTSTGSINITNGNSGYTYSIDGVNYSSSSVFNGVAAGTYTVNMKNNAGCVSSTTATINPAPAGFTVAITATNLFLCPLPSAIVPNVVATPSAAGTYTYAWTVPQGTADPGNVSAFLVNTPGVYTVNVTNSNGCNASALVTMTLAAPVSPSVADDKQVCTNSSVTLTSQTPGGYWSGNYVSGSSFDATGVAPGLYKVYYAIPSTMYCQYSEAQVTVLQSPSAPTIAVSNSCTSSTLTASNYSGSLLWNNNATTASITVNTAGTYSVVQTINGCSSGAASATVSPVQVQFQQQTINGCGSAVYNGNIYSSSTMVNDTLRNVAGCDSIIRAVSIVVNQPSVSNISVCKPAGQSYNFNGATLNVSGNYSDTLLASNGCDSIIHLKLLIATTETNTISGCESVLHNGITYSASTTLNDVIPSAVTGCDSIIRITNIIINPKPVIAISEDQVICKGDNAQLTATANNAIIQWPGYGTGNTITVAPNVNTTFTAVATTAAGCADSASVRVTIKEFNLQLTTSNSQVLSGSTVYLQSSSTSNYQVMSWTPSQLFPDQKAKTQSFMIDSTLSVMVTGLSQEGCKDSAIITIVANPLDDIYLPDAFTPNGDGKNDVFRVLGGNINSIELKVFNRWGELIFSTKEKSKGWDGTFAGREQPGAVYVYTMTATLRNGRKVFKKGTVVLVR